MQIIVKTPASMHMLLSDSTSDKFDNLMLDTHRIVTKFIKGIQKSCCILYGLNVLSREEIVSKLDYLLLKGNHQ